MQRVALAQPIEASASGERANVVDASVNGVRLSHSALFAERKPCAISFEWRGTRIAFIAEIRWTNPQGNEYLSGLEIQTIDAASTLALRRLVESSVQRMLYECHELVHGVWRKRATTDSRQPPAGFTVSSSESAHTVDFLRAAYAAGDRKMREKIRRLAELSIAHPERRYDDS